MSRLKLAFVGGGVNSAVGRAHLAALNMDGVFELVAGCFSKNPQINQQSAQTYGVSPDRIYSDFADLYRLEKGKIDAVVILTPTSAHFEPVMAAIQAEIPVICEKALVSTVADAETIRAAVVAKNGFLVTTYNYTGYPALREMRQRIQNGLLGRLCHFNAEMPQEGYVRVTADGKTIQPQPWRLSDGEIPTIYLDLGSHLHQISHYLLGLAPEEITAHHQSFGHFTDVIDYVDSSVIYKDKVFGKFNFGKSFLGKRNGLKISIYGSDASIEWVQTDPEQLKIAYRDGRIEFIDRGYDMDAGAAIENCRFKAGHPAGYVEAFANLYLNIAVALKDYKKQGCWSSYELFGADYSVDNLQFLSAMAKAAAKVNTKLESSGA
ncbi:Gfo/Idh/MocA family protein [Chitinibacter tainanensis]|uniref:Gfo/Idh/MocA family protein n=1 Tax=Chitinibacter tainanensis TaxID=230667 RepID=UPI0023571A3D|nr:Gfo/Idh/MocA family oxidoreductase [Chitinibacter tainanensis]